MFFIGQEHFMPQLGDILSYSYQTKEGESILFRGPSGFGKTELAKRCCNFLVGSGYEFCLGKNLTFNREIWVHFIDEVHLLSEPEVLYPLMDSKKWFFIFATNHDAVLPEALVNRCKNMIFSDYTMEELRQIFRQRSSFFFPDVVIDHIINVANKNPRVILDTFLAVLEKHFKLNQQNPALMDDNDLIEKINSLFGIGENGLDKLANDYIQFLKQVGGRASIDLLTAGLHVDTNTIKYQIEPCLLHRGIIRISHKGRYLV